MPASSFPLSSRLLTGSIELTSVVPIKGIDNSCAGAGAGFPCNRINVPLLPAQADKIRSNAHSGSSTAESRHRRPTETPGERRNIPDLSLFSHLFYLQIFMSYRGRRNVIIANT